MTRRNLAAGAAFVVCVTLTLTWLALPTGPGPEQSGMIKIASGAVPPATAARPTAPRAEARRVALVATQQDVDLADHQSWRVAHETRDSAWAERSEAAIRNQLRSIAYIGGKRRLDVKCAATLCEVVGIADPDPATNSYTPIWEALERDTAGDELGGSALKRTTAMFDTGRIPEEFRIQYRRVDPAPTSTQR